MTQLESRLDRMIARLLTQRACLDAAIGLVTGIEGAVVEIGLGKGRTYSHLRARLPDRRIYAFDRDVHAPPDSRPADDAIFLGDFRETLLRAEAVVRAPAALIHADIGTEKRRGDDELARFVGARVAPLLASGGILLGDRDMAPGGCERLETPRVDLPEGISPWDYFLFRRL